MLLPNNESAGKKVWGQLRHDYTVKPGYVALATLIKQLGDATMIGEMKMSEGIRGFLYRQPNGSQTVVLWAVSPLETRDARGLLPTDLPAKEVFFSAAREITATNFLGTRKVLSPEQGKIRVNAIRFPIYLSGFHGLKAEIPAQHSPKFSRNESEYEKSIVMNIRFPRIAKSLRWEKLSQSPGIRQWLFCRSGIFQNQRKYVP